MLRGIYGDPERYQQTYWAKYGDRYFAGDGCKIDDDGYFWLLGRVDDVMNVSGHRISTTEVESALVDHPQVAEAAVVGAKDDTTGQAIIAFVTVKGGVETSPAFGEELRGARREQDRPDRAPEDGDLHRRAAEDAVGQDHAPPAARRRRGPRPRRHHDAGRPAVVDEIRTRAAASPRQRSERGRSRPVLRRRGRQRSVTGGSARGSARMIASRASSRPARRCTSRRARPTCATRSPRSCRRVDRASRCRSTCRRRTASTRWRLPSPSASPRCTSRQQRRRHVGCAGRGLSGQRMGQSARAQRQVGVRPHDRAPARSCAPLRRPTIPRVSSTSDRSTASGCPRPTITRTRRARRPCTW